MSSAALVLGRNSESRAVELHSLFFASKSRRCEQVELRCTGRILSVRKPKNERDELLFGIVDREHNFEEGRIVPVLELAPIDSIHAVDDRYYTRVETTKLVRRPPGRGPRHP